MTDRLTTCLWFDKGEARKAAEFYAAVFPDSHVGPAHGAASDFPGGVQGEELTVEFTVLGRPFVGLNGGTNFKPDAAKARRAFQAMMEMRKIDIATIEAAANAGRVNA